MDKRDGDYIGDHIGMVLEEVGADLDALPLNLDFLYPLSFLDLEISLSMAGRFHSTEDNTDTLPRVPVDKDDVGMREWHSSRLPGYMDPILVSYWRLTAQTCDLAYFPSDAST